MEYKKFVFACCPTVTGLRIPTNRKLLLFARLNIPTEETSAPLSFTGDRLTCKSTFTFEYGNALTTNLCLAIRESNQQADLARLTLPLKWFQINRVVKFHFPMKTREGSVATFMFVEIHLCENHEGAFLAPPGSLTVAPAWSAPMQAVPPYPTSGVVPGPQLHEASGQFPGQFNGTAPPFLAPPQFMWQPPGFAGQIPPFLGQPPQFMAQPQYVWNGRTGQCVSCVPPYQVPYQLPAVAPEDLDQPPAVEAVAQPDDNDFIPKIEPE
jgi:hypothetical protein